MKGHAEANQEIGDALTMIRERHKDYFFVISLGSDEGAYWIEES
jgi:hypothetical protein